MSHIIVPKFDPFEKEILIEDDIRQRLSKRTKNAITRINEWLTIMHILEVKSWHEPLTNDVHFVIRADRLKTAEKIEDAVEVITKKPEVPNAYRGKYSDSP